MPLELELSGDEMRRLVRQAMERIVPAEPQLSIVAFRLAPPGHSPEILNQLNRRLLERVNARQNVYLTGTTVRGLFVIRICVLSFRTHLDRVRQGVEDIMTCIGSGLENA